MVFRKVTTNSGNGNMPKDGTVCEVGDEVTYGGDNMGKRWVFWATLVLLFVVPWLIGMGRMLTATRRAYGAEAVDRTPLPIATPAAAAIAEAFTAEYLTYDTADATGLTTRSERLRAYIMVDPYGGLVPAQETHSQRVLHTWSHGYRNASADGTSGTIIVQALVEGRADSRNLYVAVPMATDGQGRWVVTSYPQFVAAPIRAVAPIEGPDGEALPDSDGSIRALVTGFLKAYMAGAPVELGVYMAPGAPTLTGLAGTMRAQFREINEFHLIQTAPDTARAVVLATVTDLDARAAYRQRYELTLRHDNGRWAVVSID